MIIVNGKYHCRNDNLNIYSRPDYIAASKE